MGFTFLALAVLLFMLLLLPGAALLLTSRQRRETSLPGFFALSFLLSLTVWCVLLLAGLKLQLGFSLFLALEILLLSLSLFVLLYHAARRSPAAISLLHTLKRELWYPESIMVAVLSLVVAVIIAHRGGFLAYGDNWLHLAYINKFLTSARLMPDYPFFRNVPVDANYGYCCLHPLLASLVALTRSHLLFAWYYLPAILSLGVIWVNYYFARYVLRSRQLALLAVLFLVYILGFVEKFFFGFSLLAYPSYFSLLLLTPLLWLLSLHFLKTGRRSLLLLLVLGYFTLLTIHRLGALHFLMQLAFFALILVIFLRKPRGAAIRAPGVFAYLLLIFMLHSTMVPSQRVANPNHPTQRQQEMVHLNQTLFFASPRIFLFQPGVIIAHYPISILPLLGYVVLPLLLIRWRRNQLAKGFLLSTTLLPPLILFCPLLLPLLASFLTIEGTARLCQQTYFYLLVPYGLLLLVKATVGASLARLRLHVLRAPSLILFFLFLALLVGFLLLGPRSQLIRTFPNTAAIVESNPLFVMAQEINRSYKLPGDRLLSGFFTSYVLGALTGLEVFGIPEYMSSPSHSFIRERNSLVYEFFTPAPLWEKVAFCRDYQVDLLVLNPAWFSAEPFARLQQTINDHPEYFQPLTSLNQISLYRFREPPSYHPLRAPDGTSAGVDR